jgi:hypothetical protein
MTPSLCALLTGIVDYAGLFPPAGLSMDEAVRAYAAHRRGAERWMLGRFVCPVTRLDEFESATAPLVRESPDPWILSALGQGGTDAQGFVKGVWNDLACVAAFGERAGRVQVDTLEVALPPAVVASGSPHDLEHLVEGAAEIVASHRKGPRSVFFEVPLAAAGHHEVPSALRALAECRRREPPVRIGAKIRTGGTLATAVPAPEALAAFLVEARDRGVPWKATAGLHHPTRRFDPGLGTDVHGFLNVFGAAVLGHRSWLDARSLRSILHDENPASFAFDEHGFAWMQHRATTGEVEAARATVALSFGSCSFAEPVDDLRALGLLES